MSLQIVTEQRNNRQWLARLSMLIKTNDEFFETIQDSNSKAKIQIAIYENQQLELKKRELLDKIKKSKCQVL